MQKETKQARRPKLASDLFIQDITKAPIDVVQRELAELLDWQRRLDIADFKFSDKQRKMISSLFSPATRGEYERAIDAAWYAAARIALPEAIERRKSFLGIKLTTLEDKSNDGQDGNAV